MIGKKKNSILELDQKRLEDWFKSLNQPTYRADQVLNWIFRKEVFSFDEMTNLSKQRRRELERNFKILALQIQEKYVSYDGTIRFLFQLDDGNTVETVYIPHESHYTLCISSQVGCALGCRFCATGRMGIVRNLTVSEILSEIFVARKHAPAEQRCNIVFMGMGEPLLNIGNVLKAIESLTNAWGFGWSPTRITVSTSGIIPEIVRLGKMNPGFKLAVSLNAADDRTRSRLMPINRKYPLKQLLKVLKEYPLKSRQDFITFEYILIKGINDQEASALKLVKILDRKRSKINLIPMNETEFSRYTPPDADRILSFRKILESGGFNVRIRQSRGADIQAACGQLAGRVKNVS